MPTILCLRHLVPVGNRTFPIYIGFLPGEEILAISEAPAFTPVTPHESIARSIMTPPVRDWQRPIDLSRVTAIQGVYNNTTELMPNPVLLSQNALHGVPLAVKQQMAGTGIPTQIWEVEVPVPAAGSAKPLWILDGQHRIMGLAGSAQRTNPIPLVLLLNAGTHEYSAPDLAKIFAQVTTEARKLDDLHNEWLTFAFHLGNYAKSSPTAASHHDAMESVAELCLRPQFSGSGTTWVNPFHNHVKFNHQLTLLRPLAGGFAYTCVELKDIVLRHYFEQPTVPPISRLTPSEVAAELARAYSALAASVSAPQKQSVFFGDQEHEQRIMQDAFVVGVLSHLRSHPRPIDWTAVLQNLSFHATPWNFKSWVRTLGGTAQSISKNLAIGAFAEAFGNGGLRPGAGNLADQLRGNNAHVELQCSNFTSAGRPSRIDRIVRTVTRGQVTSIAIGTCRHLKITGKSANIGRLDVTDKNSPPGRLVTYNDLQHGGLTIDPQRHSNPLSLLFVMKHYGGNESQADVDVSW